MLYQYLKQNESSITRDNTSAAIPHLNNNFMFEMTKPIPPQKEAEIFYETTNPLIKLINNLYSQNTKLREARDMLLPRLMSGEIKV